jgi:3-phosphoshikimate 1-carboxyvinyltransferase
MSVSDDHHLTGDLRARSPWATLTGIHRMVVSPLRDPLHTRVMVPGSKSFTNRAILLAGVAKGTSRLRGILRSDDAYWCLESLRQLGLAVTVTDDEATIEGGGGQFPIQSGELYVGASGTVSRFLPGLLAASPTGHWTVDGSSRLRQRPLMPLLEALMTLGARIHCPGEPGALPIEVYGQGLSGEYVDIAGSTSSQFISGLLMAAPLADGPVTIRITDQSVQPAYIGITLAVMKAFGVIAQPNQDWTEFYVTPQAYQGRDINLEADASTAGYLFALAAATGQTISVSNLDYDTLQPDIQLLNILEQMGCHVTRSENVITVVGKRPLKGNQTFSLHDCSDQALTLAGIAPFADGPVTVTDIGHIRHHESDRIHAACENLGRLGIQAEEHPDGFTVYPGTPRYASLPSYDDHRVVMAFAVLGAAAQGVELLDPGAVSKTCPSFFELLSSVGIELKSDS